MNQRKSPINTQALLKKHNLKVTQARQAILTALINANKPLTAEQIAEAIAVPVNTTTIYRSSVQLVAAGLIVQTNFQDNKAYFEYQTNHHHHVVCQSCGDIEQVDVCVADMIPTLSAKTKKFSRITSHMLEFFGICKSCQ